MRIWLNDFELNNPAKRVYVNEDLEGLDLPDIRTSKGQRSGQSGGYFGAQLFDSRSISIQGKIFSADIAEAKVRRREIQAALPLYPNQLNVRIEDDDGYVYVLFAQVISFKMPIKRSQMSSLFKLELEAGDPVMYVDTAGASLEATINKAIAGGFQFTATSPQFDTTLYFTAGAPNSTVINTSTVPVFPLITITGQTTNPTLINLTTGVGFEMTGYDTSSDAVTLIDMQARTVQLGAASDIDPTTGRFFEGRGSNAFGYVTLDAEFWELVPGENEITFDSGSGSDVSSATMTWRPGVMGI